MRKTLIKARKKGIIKTRKSNKKEGYKMESRDKIKKFLAYDGKVAITIA